MTKNRLVVGALSILLSGCHTSRVSVDDDPADSDQVKEQEQDKDEQSNIGPGNPLFFGGRQGEDLFVVAFNPATDEVVSFGPAIPKARASSHHIKTVWSFAAESRVIVEVTTLDDEPKTTLFASDGKKLWPLLQDIRKVWAVRVSPRRQLIWVEQRFLDPAGEPLLKATLVTFSGEMILDRDALRWASTGFAAFAPDDSYALWLEGSALLNIVRPDGSGEILRNYGWTTPDNMVRNAAALVHAAFETSAILRDESYDEIWVDLDGNSLDVAGFDPENLWRQYQLQDDRLFRLSDRQVTQIATLPRKWLESEIRSMVVDQFALLGTHTPPLEAVDAAGGSLGVFEPASLDGTDSYSSIPSEPLIPFNTEDTKAVLAEVRHHRVVNRDQIKDLGLTYDACRFEGGETTVVRLRAYPADEPTSLRFQHRGSRVFWVEDGRLLSFDLATFEERPLDADFELLTTTAERRVSSSGS